MTYSYVTIWYYVSMTVRLSFAISSRCFPSVWKVSDQLVNALKTSLPRKCQGGSSSQLQLFIYPSNCIALKAIFPNKTNVFYSSVSGWIPMIQFHVLNAAQLSPLAGRQLPKNWPAFSPGLTRFFSDRTWSSFLSQNCPSTTISTPW